MTILSRWKIRLRRLQTITIDKFIKKERLKRFNRFKYQNTRWDSLYRYISVSSQDQYNIMINDRLGVYVDFSGQTTIFSKLYSTFFLLSTSSLIRHWHNIGGAMLLMGISYVNLMRIVVNAEWLHSSESITSIHFAATCLVWSTSCCTYRSRFYMSFASNIGIHLRKVIHYRLAYYAVICSVRLTWNSMIKYYYQWSHNINVSLIHH